ncbi:MAG: DUF2752 domain-containing protein [Gemmataceae bacterium]
MIVRPRLRPFDSPRDRVARLSWIVLLGLVYLALALWNPTTHPGPVLCASRLAVALPCPLCGATRGVALCLRGRPVEASTYNPLSLPAALFGVGLLALWSFEYLSNREVEFLFRRPWRMVVLVGAHVAVLAAWVYMLVYRREDDFATSWLGQLLSALS